jgi:hypothetical protein
MKKNSMEQSEAGNNSSQKFARMTCLLSGIAMVVWILGCGSGANSSAPAMPQQAPQAYFAPYVAGIAGSRVPQTFILDDVQQTFSQETFALQLPGQTGLQVFDAGAFTANQRGLQSLGILTTYSSLNAIGENTGVYLPTNYPAPGILGSFAVELAGQAGGLIQLVGQPVEPIVAATQCPNFATAQPYQFITIPSAVDLTLAPAPPGSPPGTPAFEQNGGTWNPTTDTAFGSVDVVSSGNSVTFKNIHQYILPSAAPAGGTGALPPPPSQQSASSVIGPCGTTTLGELTGIPREYIVTSPGANGSLAPPQAAIGIGPTGFLVEDNGSTASGIMANTSPGIHYENVLGAGTGAVGLPKPSSQLDTSAMIGEQYLGFIRGIGATNSFGSPIVPMSSHLASFGFGSPAAQQSRCSAFAAQTGPLVNGIYGGDFTSDDPSTSPDGFGNCNVAIDLGTQDDNGLFTHATVWLGANYAANTTGATYSFPVVVIAGQLSGKNAIFVLGMDMNSNQPWAIDLLQSN